MTQEERIKELEAQVKALQDVIERLAQRPYVPPLPPYPQVYPVPRIPPSIPWPYGPCRWGCY